MKLRVFRSGKEKQYDVFDIPDTKGMTVLDALFYIQDNIDSSLSFRYSCRGAVCGSCGMLVNKFPVLACRTQLDDVNVDKSKLKPFAALSETPDEWNEETEILIEPLPNFPVLNDLVVDMSKFYKSLEEMKLWTDPANGEEPRNQSPEDRKLIERYVNCIMCAICFGSCPVNADDDSYLGPAAITKSYRFYKDSRSDNPERYLVASSVMEGAPMCDLIMNCVKACPKGVAPGGAIRRLKQELKETE